MVPGSERPKYFERLYIAHFSVKRASVILKQVCQSQIHRGPKKQIGHNPRAGLVQCLLKHIEMIAHSLLHQDLTQCII